MSKEEKKILRWPGVEPGSTAWKATMLTVTPPTLTYLISHDNWLQVSARIYFSFEVHVFMLGNVPDFVSQNDSEGMCSWIVDSILILPLKIR